jgi:hypothetical protein
MSFRSDHVVVPFAVFVEHRERRIRIAAAPQEDHGSDVAEQGPVAAAVVMTGACGQVPWPATEESE